MNVTARLRPRWRATAALNLERARLHAARPDRETFTFGVWLRAAPRRGTLLPARPELVICDRRDGREASGFTPRLLCAAYDYQYYQTDPGAWAHMYTLVRP